MIFVPLYFAAGYFLKTECGAHKIFCVRRIACPVAGSIVISRSAESVLTDTFHRVHACKGSNAFCSVKCPRTDVFYRIAEINGCDLYGRFRIVTEGASADRNGTFFYFERRRSYFCLIKICEIIADIQCAVFPVILVVVERRVGKIGRRGAECSVTDNFRKFGTVAEYAPASMIPSGRVTFSSRSLLNALFFYKSRSKFLPQRTEKTKKQKNGVPSVRRSPKTNEKKYG